VSPETVAEVITEAAVSPDPKARYPVGRPGRLGVLGRFLPEPWLDAGYALVRRFSR
jgi:hypothetical protein